MSEKNTQLNHSDNIDELIRKRLLSKDPEERLKLFNKILKVLRTNWVYLVGWSGFDAWGRYYVSHDRRKCVYIAENERLEPPVRTVKVIEFSDPSELANYIWIEHKGTIPFKKIAERIKDVFGVDVKMTERNLYIWIMFGEANESDP